MGREFNSDFYNSILKCCCLEDDIASMPNGDQNIINDRGSTISGGQKARICLARVLYTEANVYLLDDPFSSLDSKISKKVFNRSILKKTANKTRVVVRNYDYLKYADKVLALDKESTLFFGNFNEFQEQFLENNLHQFTSAINLKKINEKLQENQNLDEKMTSIQKPIPPSTYMTYINLGFRNKFFFSILIIIAISQALSILYFYYFTTVFTGSSDSMELCLYYLFLLILMYILYILVAIILSTALYYANLHLHNNATKRISKLLSSYYESNTSGTIINIFTKDISVVDCNLVPLLQEFSIFFFQIVCQLILVMIIFPPTIIFVTLFIIEAILIFIYIIPVSNISKRLQIALKGPIISTTCSSLSGILTIRTLRLENYMNEILEKSSTLLHRITITADYIGSLSIDLLEFGFIFILISNISMILFTPRYFSLELSLVTINFMVALYGASSTLFLLFTKIDNCMLSVQNILDISNLPKENQSKAISKMKNFEILEGKIEFSNLTVKYGEKIALNCLSCIIQPGSSVGVIGRTGAGKSTIFKVILRLVDPSSGTIFFDGKDYLLYTHKSIRKAITTSPQTISIFYGSIRQNLDPFHYYSNEKIKSMLLTLKLYSIHAIDLDDESFGKTINLSVGEKQLLCLARLLLKKSKIVLIDEATSYVDSISEKFVQEIMKKALDGCTILTITHRLENIKNHDYALVIDNGDLVEFGLITDLDSDSSSQFRKYKNALDH